MRRDSNGQGRPGRGRAIEAKRKEGFEKEGVGHTIKSSSKEGKQDVHWIWQLRGHEGAWQP